MEIEIESKRNNPLLNRTEVYFTIKHANEKTPNREIIRSELADKLNAKKENIIVGTISSSFGVQETTGYAKVYTSLEKSKNIERKYMLKRNKIGVKEEKKEKTEKKSAETPADQPPVEEPKEESVSEPTEKKPAEGEPEPEEVSKEEKKEESDIKDQPKEEEQSAEQPSVEEKPAEETSTKESEEKKGD